MARVAEARLDGLELVCEREAAGDDALPRRIMNPDGTSSQCGPGPVRCFDIAGLGQRLQALPPAGSKGSAPVVEQMKLSGDGSQPDRIPGPVGVPAV